jgi:hypothetical protein
MVNWLYGPWPPSSISLACHMLCLYSSVGYSDFHNLMGFSPAKRCQIIVLNLFVKKVCQLVKPFLAILHFFSSNNFIFFACEYPKDAEFYEDLKSPAITGKKCSQKVIYKKLLQVSCIEEDKLQFAHFFCL